MEPKAFEIYRHFKGNLYQVITLAEEEGSGEILVIYQGLYAPFKVYARPLSAFTEKLDRAIYPDAAQDYRFERAMEEKPIAEVPTERLSKEQTAVAEKAVPAAATEDVPAAAAAQSAPEADMMETAGGINPDLLLFLDAREPEDKLDALFRIKSRLTPDMLTVIEMSQGMEPQEAWSIEERYKHIKNDIITKQKYEQKRI